MAKRKGTKGQTTRFELAKLAALAVIDTGIAQVAKNQTTIRSRRSQSGPSFMSHDSAGDKMHGVCNTAIVTTRPFSLPCK
jgi:hypothetical protein